MIKKCEICSRDFYTCHPKTIFCCSNDCRGKRRSKFNVVVACLICGVKQNKKPSRVKYFKTCSKKCFSMLMKGHKPSNFNGGRYTHRGYVYILSKDHPHCDKKGYVSEHRLIMEKQVGRYLTEKEVVHHKDGDKSNNILENLLLSESQSECTASQHVCWSSITIVRCDKVR